MQTAKPRLLSVLVAAVLAGSVSTATLAGPDDDARLRVAGQQHAETPRLEVELASSLPTARSKIMADSSAANGLPIAR